MVLERGCFSRQAHDNDFTFLKMLILLPIFSSWAGIEDRIEQGRAVGQIWVVEKLKQTRMNLSIHPCFDALYYLLHGNLECADFAVDVDLIGPIGKVAEVQQYFQAHWKTVFRTVALRPCLPPAGKSSWLRGSICRMECQLPDLSLLKSLEHQCNDQKQ